MNPAAINEFYELVQKISGQGDSWSILELFKAKFNGGSSRSSSESWALSDLHHAMHGAGNNCPAFIDAFWTGCAEVKTSFPRNSVPDESVINRILADHGEPYEVRPPKLVARNQLSPPNVSVPEIGNNEKSRFLIEKSLNHADQFLLEHKPRQAVQEIMWLLETVITGFDGHETQSGTVEGKYLNQIVRNLSKQQNDTALRQVFKWMAKLHGYLSTPTGGGVRHGTDLKNGLEMSENDARLYCNLTRSYIDYLLSELAKQQLYESTTALSSH